MIALNQRNIKFLKFSFIWGMGGCDDGKKKKNKYA
jgi:hypothetical protein